MTQPLSQARRKLDGSTFRFVLKVISLMAFHSTIRGVQILVIGPAVIAGILLFLWAVSGGNPGRELVTSVYTFADTQVRHAPAGMVSATVCLDKQTAPALPSMTSKCLHTEVVQVPLATAIDQSVATLKLIYAMFVGLSALIVFALFPGLSFVYGKNHVEYFEADLARQAETASPTAAP